MNDVSFIRVKEKRCILSMQVILRQAARCR